MLRAILSVTALMLIALPTAADAQTAPRFFAGAGVGSFSVSADHVDGRSFATSIAGGLAVGRHIDVEIEFAVPADSFSRSYTGPSVSFAQPGASQSERDRLAVITRFDRTRAVSSSFSAVVVIRPSLGRRVTPGVILGVTNQRVLDTTVYTPISVPEGVDPEHPAVAARTEEARRNLGGPTLGAQVAIAITPRLFVVPDVRYDYGSIGDEINNTFRATVRMLWRF